MDEQEDMKLTFGVLKHSLNQHWVLCYPLGHQQDAFWDAEPPHNAATHLFLEERTTSVVLKRANITGG